MSNPLSRIGLHINANMPGDTEKLLSVLRAWKPTGVVVMNALNASDPGNTVMRILRTMQEWGGVVIYRPYSLDEGHLWTKMTPQQHVQNLLNFGTKEFWFNVGNEPAPNAGKNREAMDKWYAEFVQRAHDAGLRTVIPGGFAAASFEKVDVDRGDFDRMFTAIGERADDRIQGFSKTMFGVHVYGHALLPLMTAGRNPADLIQRDKIQPKAWPTKEEIFDDDQSNNWLLFREEWYLDRMFHLTGKRPDTAFSEFGHDRMPNIEVQFPVVTKEIDRLAGRWIKGSPTLVKYWEWAFKETQGWSPAESLCEQLVWWERIAPPHYKIAALWAWTWHNAPPEYWKDTGNVGEFDEFLSKWPLYAKKLTTPPQPPQLPLPTDSRWVAMKAQAKVNAGVNVRSKPTTAADRIGGIQHGGVLIHTIPYVQLGDLQAIAKPGGVEWYLVKLADNTIGWVHSNYLTLEAVEPTPPVEEWRQKLLAIADTLIEVGNIGLLNASQAKEGYEKQIEMLVAIRNDLENAR